MKDIALEHGVCSEPKVGSDRTADQLQCDQLR